MHYWGYAVHINPPLLLGFGSSFGCAPELEAWELLELQSEACKPGRYIFRATMSDSMGPFYSMFSDS